MQLNVYEMVDEVLKNTADYFVTLANETTSKKQRFSVALSGGNSPKKLYALLASDAYKNKIDWNNIDFFFGDERYVPHTDAASNFKMVNEVLFVPLNIPAEHIFPVNTSFTPSDAASKYWEKIALYFKNSKQNVSGSSGRQTPFQFDLILLGLGDNVHTASLFPHTPVLDEISPSVKSVSLPDKTHRITFTAPLINLADNVAFLVYGNDKAEAVHNAIEGLRDIQKFPAQLIQPLNGNLAWYLDKPAASKLKTPSA